MKNEQYYNLINQEIAKIHNFDSTCEFWGWPVRYIMTKTTSSGITYHEKLYAYSIISNANRIMVVRNILYYP